MKRELTSPSIFTSQALKKQGPLYLAGLALLAVAKYYYSKAGSDDLLWLLSPTARLVTILSGIDFTYIPGTGYVNHAYQFIIAGSCSGFQFMTIASAMLFFSFLPRMETRTKGAVWLGAAVMLSYIYTVFINSWRILVSVRLPLYLRKRGFFYAFGTWLTPERLHTVIGIFIYFSSLLSWAIPFFWYFAVVLGIPFLNQAWRRDLQAFAGYVLLMLLVCLPILLLFILAGRILCGKSEG